MRPSRCKMRIDFPDVGNAGKSIRLSAQRAMGEPDRQVVFARQPRHAADVVAVLMGDDYAAQLLGRHTQTRQTHQRVLQSKAAVHQHLRLAGRNQQRVAFAAAAQRRKTHGH